MGDDSEYVKYLVRLHYSRAWSSAFRSSGGIQRSRYSSIISKMDGLLGNHSEHFGLVAKNDYKLFRRRR
jgi:hypothetical protein